MSCTFSLVKSKINRCIVYALQNADTLIVTVDSLFFSFFLLFLIPLSHENLYTLRLCGSKHDRLKLLTQCAEWPEFSNIF